MKTRFLYILFVELICDVIITDQCSDRSSRGLKERGKFG